MQDIISILKLNNITPAVATTAVNANRRNVSRWYNAGQQPSRKYRKLLAEAFKHLMPVTE